MKIETEKVDLKSFSRDEKRAELFEFIHLMFSEGHTRLQITKALQERYSIKKRTAYEWVEKYLKEPKYVEMREDIRVYIKNTMLSMYKSNFAKGYYRAAMEVMDRLLVVCPWIKDATEDTQYAPIKVEIIEKVVESDEEPKDPK